MERTVTNSFQVIGKHMLTKNNQTSYQRAYLDFFEDEVVRYNYDWKQVLMDYLLQGDEPLLNGLISGRM